MRGPRRGRESAARKLARLATLQGFLLPRRLLIDRTTVLDKAFHRSASQLFRYRRVLYRHARSGTGYVAVHDRRRFFAELRNCVNAAATLRSAYADGAAKLTTQAFWRGAYGLGDADVDEAESSKQGQTGQMPECCRPSLSSLQAKFT